MRQLPVPRHALRFSVALTLAAGFAVPIAAVACGVQHEIWICINPDTGKLDDAPYDENNYVNGVFDPCHCYDPCGPSKACPSAHIDAGSGAACDAGDGG